MHKIKKKDFSNSIHGKYLILNKAYTDKHDNAWYKAKCTICGSEITLSHFYLTKTSLYSCKCKTILKRRKILGIER